MNNKIKPHYVNFNTAKLLKEKGFDEECTRFYTKPNSKMFGIDEHGRNYPINNKPKTLWIVGNAATLNIKNVLFAPEQHIVVEWLRINHGINVLPIENYHYPDNISRRWKYQIINKQEKDRDIFNKKFFIESDFEFNSPQEAYRTAFDYVLKELI